MAMTVEVVVEPGCSRIPRKRPKVLEYQIHLRLRLGDLRRKVVVLGRCWREHDREQLTPGRGQRQMTELRVVAGHH